MAKLNIFNTSWEVAKTGALKFQHVPFLAMQVAKRGTLHAPVLATIYSSFNEYSFMCMDCTNFKNDSRKLSDEFYQC